MLLDQVRGKDIFRKKARKRIVLELICIFCIFFFYSYCYDYDLRLLNLAQNIRSMERDKFYNEKNETKKDCAENQLPIFFFFTFFVYFF